jgi:hypothetical protein
LGAQADTYSDDNKVSGGGFSKQRRDGDSLKDGIEMSDITQDADKEELIRRSFAGNETDTGIFLLF